MEIAYGNENPLPGANKEEIIERVKQDLVKAEILNRDDEIVFLDTYDIKYGYVLYDKEKKSAVKTIHSFLKPFNIIPCGRYGLWAYLWSDEAMMSGKVAAEKLLNES